MDTAVSVYIPAVGESVIAYVLDDEPVPCYTDGDHTATGKMVVQVKGTASITATDNSSVLASENARVVLEGHAYLEAWNNVVAQCKGNSEAHLHDDCRGTVLHTADVWAHERVKLTAWGGRLRLYDNSHATISNSHVLDATDNSTISLVAESQISARGRVVITQGPFVDASLVTCEEDAKLVGAPRRDESKKGFSPGLNNRFGGI